MTSIHAQCARTKPPKKDVTVNSTKRAELYKHTSRLPKASRMVIRRRAMKRPPSSILLCLLFTIALIPFLYRPFHTSITNLSHESTEQIRETHSEDLQPYCSFITPPSATWSYNSRSFCVFPTACITPSNVVLPTLQPLCASVTASFKRFYTPRNCTYPELSHVTCAYSPGLRSGNPVCAPPLPLQHQIPEISNVIVVPLYPYPANIYHFANVRTTLLHHIRHHNPSKPVTVIIRGSPNRNSWQTQFDEVIMDAISALNPYITFRYLPTDESICASRVTILGRRGHTNVWPFPNTTHVTPEARQIPTESLHFRHVFYDAFGIHHPLFDGNQVLDKLPHPPLVLGYARRLGPGASTGGNVHAIGTMRRFSDADEAWFQGMLEEETSIHGVKLRIFTTSADDSLHDQVSNFASLGGVIGIHGANLVNSMFMPPLSTLIEVFPAEVTSLCYFAGGNAGLRYFRFESEDPASPEESGCVEGRCKILTRQRLVKIGRESERLRLRERVREALLYLTGLRKRFPDGVPVVDDPVRGMYNVVE